MEKSKPSFMKDVLGEKLGQSNVVIYHQDTTEDEHETYSRCYLSGDVNQNRAGT